MDGFFTGNVPPSSSMTGIVPRCSLPEPAFKSIPLSITTSQNPAGGANSDEDMVHVIDEERNAVRQKGQQEREKLLRAMTD